jgi:hypothetical protein
MKISTLYSLACAVALLANVSAQANGEVVAPADDHVAHFLLSGGITYGGDTLETANYNNGTSIDIKAGGLIQFGTGVRLQLPDEPISLQLTANYQWDEASSRNGNNVRFTRVPLEATLFFAPADHWRLGLGARYVTNAHLRGPSNLGYYSDDYKNSTGVLFDAGYQPIRHLWIDGRYVVESYTSKYPDLSGNMPKYNANHFGIFATGEF